MHLLFYFIYFNPLLIQAMHIIDYSITNMKKNTNERKKLT